MTSLARSTAYCCLTEVPLIRWRPPPKATLSPMAPWKKTSLLTTEKRQQLFKLAWLTAPESATKQLDRPHGVVQPALPL